MDIQEKRHLDLFNTIDYFSLGSLWKIKNYLWQKVISDFVSKQETGFHPALCLGKKNLTSLCQTIPMLLGSHSVKNGFPIRHFSHTNEKRIGFFKIRPYFFQAQNAIGKHAGIERNDYKPRLDQEEISQLQDYLLQKGIKYED